MAVGGWEVCVLSACVTYLPNERLNSSQKSSCTPNRLQVCIHSHCISPYKGGTFWPVKDQVKGIDDGDYHF